MDNLISNDRLKGTEFRNLLIFALAFSVIVSILLAAALGFNFFWTLLVSAVSSFFLACTGYNIANDNVFCANGLIKAVKAIWTGGVDGETWAFLWCPYLYFTFAIPILYPLTIILLSPIDMIIANKKEQKNND